MKLLTVQDVQLIHMQIIDASGGSQGTRAVDRIESAVAAQNQEVFGTQLYPTVFEKAAAMVRGIVADHPFVDGNKRTGIMVGLTLLNLNGKDTSSIDDKELEDFAVKIATDHLSVADIAKWLERHTR
jgi:death-on-curing protein